MSNNSSKPAPGFSLVEKMPALYLLPAGFSRLST
jgi:hypothetical protein